MAWYNFKNTSNAGSTPVDKNPSVGESTNHLSAVSADDMVSEDIGTGTYIFGPDNKYPDYLNHLADNSPTHNAIIQKTGLMIAGENYTVEWNSDELLDIVHTKMLLNHPNKKHDFRSIMKAVGKNYKGNGRFAIECIWNEDHDRVIEITFIDVGEVRIGIQDGHGEIPLFKQSIDWTGEKTGKVQPVTTYFPFGRNLQGHKQLLYMQKMRSGHLYYGLPDFYSTIKWIRIEAGIGDAHLNSVENGFAPSVAVVFPGKPDSTKIEKKIVDNLNKNYGGPTGKKILAIFAPNKDLKPEINAIDVKNLHSQYDSVDERTERKILTGHGVTTPLIFGITTSSGFSSNAEEMLVGFNTYNSTTVHPDQEDLQRAVNMIMQESGNPNRINIVPYSFESWMKRTES